MALYYKNSFKRSYKKRFTHNSKTRTIIKKKIDLFLENPKHPVLRVHPLQGIRKGYYSFSVTGDIRIIFYIFQSDIYFVDIGTHNQVYD